MTPSLKIKQAMIAKLKKDLPATSNGTEIQNIVESGEEAFDDYPVLRVIPSGVERIVSEDNRSQDYVMSFVLSCYLDIGQMHIPDSEVINTMMELVDNVILTLDENDWQPELAYDDGQYLMANATTSLIDTTATKNGSALYCDISYSVAIRKAVV